MLIPSPLPPSIKCVPDYLLLEYGCQTDEACKSNRCGCSSKSMPCTMFCACEGAEGCHNPFKKPEVGDDPNDMNCDDDDDAYNLFDSRGDDE